MFFVDVILACLPMINANRSHGWLIGLVVYAVALGVFRSADRWATAKGGIWLRLALKAIAFVLVEGLVLLSAAERCSPDMSTCARLFF